MLAWLWQRLGEGGPRASISGRVLRDFPQELVTKYLRARVLVELESADWWQVCAHCECELEARPVRVVRGRLCACCPYDCEEDLELDPGDLRRFRIDVNHLVGAIATSGGLSPAPTGIGNGIWLLGNTARGYAVVLCLDHEELQKPVVVLAIKEATRAANIIVLASNFGQLTVLRLRDAGVQPVRLAEAMAGAEGWQERLTLEPKERSASGLRVILNRTTKSLKIDGRDIYLSEQAFRLFRMLAEQRFKNDPILRKQVIETDFRSEARFVVSTLRQRLRHCGLTGEDANALVRTIPNRGYRLGPELHEIAIEDEA